MWLGVAMCRVASRCDEAVDGELGELLVLQAPGPGREPAEEGAAPLARAEVRIHRATG